MRGRQNLFTAVKATEDMLMLGISGAAGECVQSNMAFTNCNKACRFCILIVNAKSIDAQAVRTYIYILRPTAMKHAALGTSVWANP